MIISKAKIDAIAAYPLPNWMKSVSDAKHMAIPNYPNKKTPLLEYLLTIQKEPMPPKKPKIPIRTVLRLAGIFESAASLTLILVTSLFENIPITFKADCYNKLVITTNINVLFIYFGPKRA